MGWMQHRTAGPSHGMDATRESTESMTTRTQDIEEERKNTETVEHIAEDRAKFYVLATTTMNAG